MIEILGGGVVPEESAKAANAELLLDQIVNLPRRFR
jgi:hypothetical protein